MEEKFQLLLNILKGSKRFDFEGTVLTISNYYTGEEISLDLSNLSEEAFAEILVQDDFWEQREDRVWNIAYENNLDHALESTRGFGSLDEFLFDVFDNGDYGPTDEEIITAIIEYTS